MIKVNDIFVKTWGYGQTNVDFYQIVELSKSGKTAYLKKIDKYSTDENGVKKKYPYNVGAGFTMPLPNRFVPFIDETDNPDADKLKKKVCWTSKGTPCFHMNNARSMISGQVAFPWDGKPIRESWYY